MVMTLGGFFFMCLCALFYLNECIIYMLLTHPSTQAVWGKFIFRVNYFKGQLK